MKPQRLLASCLLLACSLAMAQDKSNNGDGEVKNISGMSIVGNNETPKSLTIIPWKGSEIGQENDLRSSLLNNDVEPVNKDVFVRELNFYNLSNPR